MKHLTPKEALEQSKDCPEGEIFAVHESRPRQQSAFIMTSVDNEEWFCFGMKLKGQIFCSDWVSESQGKKAAVNAFKQLLFIKQGGYFYTGESRYDSLNLHKEPLFRCVYCSHETVDVKGPCSCRKIGAHS